MHLFISIFTACLLITVSVGIAVFVGPRVLSLLIGKYLGKRRIAWVSLIAVMLCTAMVLVVISVMGGWLRMFRESFHGLTGDVIVHARSPMVGFPRYQEIIDQVEALPEVEAAVPTIRTFGLINIGNRIRDGVQVVGFPDDIGRVNAFPRSLYRQYQQSKDHESATQPSTQPFALLPSTRVPYEFIKPNVKNGARSWPGMIVGDGVVGIKKNEAGVLERPPGDLLYEQWANLKVLGVSPGEDVDLAQDKADRTYWIVDDSRTQIWQYDANTVYVPFDVLQKDLKMREFEDLPARTTDVQIKLKAGADLNATKSKIKSIVDGIIGGKNFDPRFPYVVETWEESQALWLGAIEKEKVLVTVLFAMISVVAIFLIFCIFYMIVMEKTKDIGIVKSVGATSTSVATIFLGYGLAIGIVGAAMGFLFGYLIVHNINFLHEQMGRLLGISMWNPEVYAFDVIPNTMDPREVIVICLIAVVSAVAGALVPAIRAASMNPVDALRWE